jgi:hypothetical protein
LRSPDLAPIFVTIPFFLGPLAAISSICSLALLAEPWLSENPEWADWLWSFRETEGEEPSEESDVYPRNTWRSGWCDTDEECEGKDVDENEFHDILSGMSSYRQWHRVYYSEPARRGWRAKRKGKILMLVRKVDQEDEDKEMWVAVDNARKVHLIDVKDKTRYHASRNPRVGYDEFRGLWPWEKVRVEGAAANLASRAGNRTRTRSRSRSASRRRGVPKSGPKKNTKKNSKQKKPNQRTASLMDWTSTAWSMCTCFWAWRSLGAIPAILILIYRVLTMLEVPETVVNTVDNSLEIWEDLQDRKARVVEIWEWVKGVPWDIVALSVFLLFGCALPLLWALWKGEEGAINDDGSTEGSDYTEESENQPGRREEDTQRKVDHQMQQLMEHMTALAREVKEIKQGQGSTNTSSLCAELSQKEASLKDMLDRVKLQEEIIQRDREDAGKRKKDILEFLNAEKPDEVRSPGADGKETLREELDSFNLEMKDHARWQIESYNPNLPMKLPMNLKEHVGPVMVARSYKKGKSMASEWEDWLTRKFLTRSSIAPEVRLISRSMDADVKDRKARCLEKESFEIRARRLYGFSRAFEKVQVEADWRKPAGDRQKGWKSKVVWPLLELYDVPALEREGISIEKVDDEAETVMNRQNKFESYAQRVSQAQSRDQTRERVVVGIDDD